MKRKHLFIPLLIFLFSLIINIIYLLELRKSPLFYFPQMDAFYHLEWANKILSGDLIGKEVFFRAPLYPYFLALILKITSGNLLLARFLQVSVGSVSVILVYFVSYRFFSRKVAISSSIIASIYAPLIYFNCEFLIVPLIVFLDLLIILSLYKALKTSTFRNWCITGLLTGLSAIARPNILLPALLLPLFLFFYFKKKLLKNTFAFFVGIFLIIFPVFLRNYIVGKDFVPIASQAGVNFYIGNNLQSDGMTAIVPGTRGTWWGGYHDAIRIAEKETGRKLKPSQVSNFWTKKGIEFIVHSPVSFIKLTIRKFFLLLSGMEISNNKDIYFFKRYSRLLNFLIWKLSIKIPPSSKIPFFIFGFPFSLLLPFSIYGIILSMNKKDKEKLLLFFLIVTYSISIIIFFVNSRYRIPIIPIVIMFAVYGFIEIFKKRKIIFFLIPIIVFLTFNVNFWRVEPPGNAQSFYAIGISYGKAQKFKEALVCYEEAIKEDPLLFDAYTNIGNIYARFNMDDNAVEMYNKSIEINPQYEKAYFNLGHISLKNNKLNEAYEYYKLAYSLDPYYHLAYFYAGIVKERMGEIEKAKEFYSKTLSIKEDFIPAKEKLEGLKN